MDNSLLPKWMLNTLGVLFIIFLALITIQQLHHLNGSPQTMSVSATGKATMVPDLAIVTIGVISQGANPIDVKNTNNLKINQMLNFIKQQGVEAKDIQTSNFSASPRYNYANGQNNMVGYEANQTVTIKIRNIDKSTAQLEKVVDGAVMSGANQIQGITFSFVDDDQLSQIARKQAIEKAKQKAKEIAKDAGLRLGRIVNVITSENNGYAPRPLMANAAAARAGTTPDIEPGSQEVTETVTVVFEVK